MSSGCECAKCPFAAAAQNSSKLDQNADGQYYFEMMYGIDAKGVGCKRSADIIQSARRLEPASLFSRPIAPRGDRG